MLTINDATNNAFVFDKIVRDGTQSVVSMLGSDALLEQKTT